MRPRGLGYALAWLIGAAAACSSNPAGPFDTLVHVSLGGRPFGLAVSANDVLYTTRVDAASLVRINLPDLTFAAAINVGSAPSGVAFNAAGTTAYATNQFSQNVSVIDVANDSQVDVIPVRGNPFQVIVAPGGQRIYVSTNANKLYAINPTTKSATDSLSFGAPPNGLALHPGGVYLYASTLYQGTVVEIDMQTFAIRRSLPIGGIPQGLAVSADGAELYVANEAADSAGGLDIWNLNTGAPITTVPIGGYGFGIGLSPDGRWLYVSQSLIGQVQIVDRAQRAVVKTLETGGRPRRIGFDRAGSITAVANEGGWIDFVK